MAPRAKIIILIDYEHELSGMWTRDLFQDVFERQMTERVHAFVGLMGIPIMRRDYRVRLGDQVLVKSYETRRVENTNFYINGLLLLVTKNSLSV